MNSTYEGPGAAVALAYLFMILYGMLFGIGIGWLIWG